jgi:transcription termination/antitermination protein NusG
MSLSIFKKKEESRDNWYALFVETGQEDKVKERISYRMKDKLKILVPKRKFRERKNGIWSDKIRVLFPGYVLLNGFIEREDYDQFYNVPGLYKLLKSGQDPLKIELNEMEIINKLTINNETIEISKILFENGKVKVVDGPLMTLEGQIISIDRRKGRAKVKLDFLGEDRTVELGINILEPATD